MFSVMLSPVTNTEISEPFDAVSTIISEWATDLLGISHAIHADPELSFEEHNACELLASKAEQAGFDVTRGAFGLKTSFSATRGDGPFRVVICAEYDALPEVGHACGHNVIAASALGAAVALAEVASEYGLSVVLLGTPAEEHGAGKTVLLERGAWESATMSIMAHGYGGHDIGCAQISSRGVDRFDVTFTGRASHAAAAPQLGVNAGDAATLSLVAIGLLRQQLSSDICMNAYVELGGEATNIIPARTLVRAEVRGFALADLLDAKRRMLACFEGAAIATGCEWKTERSEPLYAELVQCPTLARQWDEELRQLGRTIVTEATLVIGSTDMGNVSQVVPTIHPIIAFRGKSSATHTIEFAEDSVSEAADEAVIHAAIAMARTVIAVASGDSRQELLTLAADRAPGSTRVPLTSE